MTWPRTKSIYSVKLEKIFAQLEVFRDLDGAMSLSSKRDFSLTGIRQGSIAPVRVCVRQPTSTDQLSFVEDRHKRDLVRIVDTAVGASFVYADVAVADCRGCLL